MECEEEWIYLSGYPSTYLYCGRAICIIRSLHWIIASDSVVSHKQIRHPVECCPTSKEGAGNEDISNVANDEIKIFLLICIHLPSLCNIHPLTLPLRFSRRRRRQPHLHLALHLEHYISRCWYSNQLRLKDLFAINRYSLQIHRNYRRQQQTLLSVWDEKNLVAKTVVLVPINHCKLQMHLLRNHHVINEWHAR